MLLYVFALQYLDNKPRHSSTFLNMSHTYILMLISDIVSPMLGNAPCHCFLLLVSEGRKEGRRTRCVFIRKQWCIVGIYRWPLFIEQGWNISPISHSIITQYYVTSEKMIIIMESNCYSGVVLLCWLHFVDGNLQRVMFPPISHPPWANELTVALLL